MYIPDYTVFQYYLQMGRRNEVQLIKSIYMGSTLADNGCDQSKKKPTFHHI